MESSRAYFETVRPHMPESLLPQDPYDRLLESAQAVPGACADHEFGFECPLTGEPWADFGFKHWPGGAWGDAVEHARTPGGADPSAWAAWRRHGRRWPSPALRYGYSEFDSSGARPTTPSLFWTLFKRLPRRDKVRALWDVFPADRAEAAAAVVATVSESWRLASIGAMYSRPGGVVRINLQGPYDTALRELPRLLADGADRGAILRFVETVLTGYPWINVSLDITDRLQPRVGLVAIPQIERAGEPSRAEIMRRLAAAGLADADRGSAALGFYGKQSIFENAEVWPEAVRGRWISEGGNATPYILRSLVAVKAQFDPGQPPFAKAYLSCLMHWQARTGGRARPSDPDALGLDVSPKAAEVFG